MPKGNLHTIQDLTESTIFFCKFGRLKSKKHSVFLVYSSFYDTFHIEAPKATTCSNQGIK